MFRNRKPERINLSNVFLEPGAKPAVQPHPTPSSGKKASKGFIAILLIICTTAVAAFVVSNNIGKVKPHEAKKPAAAANTTNESVNQREVFIEDIERKAETVDEEKNRQNEENSLTIRTSSNTTNRTTAPSSKNSVRVEDRQIKKLQYKIASRAFFYSQPNRKAKGNKSIVWKNSYAPFNALAEENGFIYAVITDSKGRDIEGWLRKQDLKEVKTTMYESDLK
jgi:hypothetical protein